MEGETRSRFREIQENLAQVHQAVQLQRVILDELFPLDLLSVDIKNSYRQTITRLEKEIAEICQLLNSEDLSKEALAQLFKEIAILHQPRYIDSQGQDVTLTKTSSGDFEWNDSITLYQEFQKGLEKKAEEWTHPLVGTPFQDYILELILKDDNTFNKKALRHPFPKIGRSTIEQRQHFLENIRSVFDFDLEEVMRQYAGLLQSIEAGLVSQDGRYQGKVIRHRRYLPSLKEFEPIESKKEGKAKEVEERKAQLKRELLLHCLWGEYLKHIAAYLFSLDTFNLYNVFKVDIWGNLHPVPSYEKCRFSDLVGYEREKAILVKETAAFLAGKDTNNIFIYGPPGTGKSSSINALLSEFEDLRMILMDKHQASLLSTVYSKVAGSCYPFIIAFDELSYDARDESYKRLQEAMEGVVDKLPKNVRIYAAANTKYPVKVSEDSDGGPPDAYAAIADRFGIKIKFEAPNEKVQQEILLHYARKKEVLLSLPELAEGFRCWCQENDHYKPNGRNIRDYIRTLASKEQGSLAWD